MLATVISEVNVEPRFGNHDTDQYVELRGTPNTTLPNGSYFVVIEGWGSVPGGIGYVHSSINLSGLSFGSNGFLVIAQSGHPYQVDPSSTLLVSSSPGFSGLPGNRWNDASTLSDRFAFIFSSGTFMLIQAPIAPVPASDADANDDGTLDGAAANWTVIDSVGLLNTTASPSRSYGKITFSDEPNYNYPVGTLLVETDGGGYVGRIGASTNWAASDWVSGTTVDGDTSPTVVDYRFTFGTFGDPRPLVYAGRSLNHLGTYNFDGGARGAVGLDTNGDGKITSSDDPLPNVSIFADKNQNGVRDSVTTSVVAINYTSGTELTNRFSNATLTVADANNKNIGHVVRTKSTFDNSLNTIQVLSSEGIPWFESANRLKVLFYREADSVSIESIAGENLKDSFGRMEIYDRNNQLLGFAQTAPLRGLQRETLKLNRANADIKYAVIYTNNNVANSSPFGPFDRLSYSYPEFLSVSDPQGLFAIEELPKGNYNIVAIDGPTGKILLPSTPSSYALGVSKTEHLISADFGFRNNLPPVVSTVNLTIDENPSLGSIVSKVVATDPDPGQKLTYQFLSDAGPFGIDASTGNITVINGNSWDFEKSTQIIVQVKVTDNFQPTASTTRQITISLGDLNEPPIINQQEFSIPENSPSGTVIGAVVATDPDAGTNGVFRYALGSGVPSNTFAIDPINGKLTTLPGAVLDFETKPTWSIPISVTDQGTPPLTGTSQVVLRLIDVNEPPTNIAFTNVVAVAESTPIGTTTRVADIRIVDDALGTAVLSLSGPDAALFSIVDGHLQFKNTNALDFETKPKFVVVVSADDPSVGPSPDVSVNFELKIADVNEAPTGIEFVDLNTAIPESTSTAAGVRVANIKVIDDALGLNTLILSGTEASKFVIVGNELRIKPNTLLDFELQSIYRVVVGVDDVGVGLTPDASSPIEVNITDVNEPPTELKLDVLATSVDESLEPTKGFAVGELHIVDDALGSNKLELVGSDVASYEIVGTQLRIKPGVVFDFEKKPTYEVTVRAVDAGLPGSVFPVVVSRLSVRNLPEVVSITDNAGQSLGNVVRSVRLGWDSAVSIATGAISLLKSDIGGTTIPTTFTSSIVGGRTVVDLQFSGPFVLDGALLDGDYTIAVDGTKVEDAASGSKGLPYRFNPIVVRAPSLPGTLELSGPATTLRDKPFSIQTKLSGLSFPLVGNVDYKIDMDGNGSVDGTVSGPATHILNNLSFSSAGSYTIMVSAEKNGTVLGQASLLIDVAPATTVNENWLSALDADRDNTISPLDVLVIVNRINNRIGSDPIPYRLNEDVDRDGAISPLDVLALINYLNADHTTQIDVFSSLSMAEPGTVPGLTNDNTISGKINGTSRSLFITLDGVEKKDASRFVKPDGSFVVQDAAIAELFGNVSDGDHTISVMTRTNGQYSIAVDKRFKRITNQLADFQIMTVLSKNGETRVQWSNSASGARYKVFVSSAGAPAAPASPVIVTREARLILSPGNYSVYVEAMDGAGNLKRTSALSVIVS